MTNLSLKEIYRHRYMGSTSDPAPLALAADPPRWRMFGSKPELTACVALEPRAMEAAQAKRGQDYLADEEEAKLVNAALILRRPLLITGPAGIGKTSLAYSVAWQLGLGNVMRWGITSRSTLKEALYQYDALARLHDTSLLQQTSPGEKVEFGQYFTLGALGTALLPTRSAAYHPRVLLIDEIDKSDADLPSDLLHVLEEGWFPIPEIDRLPASQKSGGLRVRTSDPSCPEFTVNGDGRIQCDDFPFIIMTSNGEREFPPAFLRRCLQLSIPWERREGQLESIVQQHLGQETIKDPNVSKLIEMFRSQRNRADATLAIDQLLNAIYLLQSRADVNPLEHEGIRTAIFRSLNEMPSGGDA